MAPEVRMPALPTPPTRQRAPPRWAWQLGAAKSVSTQQLTVNSQRRESHVEHCEHRVEH
jgi:hypothetical protein